jgi:hypothetical protein
MTEDNLDSFPNSQELYKYFEKEDLIDKICIGTVGTERIDSIIDRLLNLPEPLKKDFLHWWQTGELKSSVNVKGITVDFVSKKRDWDVAFTFAEFADVYLNPNDRLKFSLLTERTEIVDGWIGTW